MLGQVGGHQQLHSFLTDHLVTRGVPPPGDVGIDRYLSGGTGSRGNAHQVYRSAAALFLNVLDRPLAQIYLHRTPSLNTSTGNTGMCVTRVHTDPLNYMMQVGGLKMQADWGYPSQW